MTKQPGIQQVGILLAPTVVFIHFHDTFFSPPIPGWQRMTMMKYLWDKATSHIDWGERTTRVQYLPGGCCVVVLLVRGTDTYVYCRYL